MLVNTMAIDCKVESFSELLLLDYLNIKTLLLNLEWRQMNESFINSNSHSTLRATM